VVDKDGTTVKAQLEKLAPVTVIHPQPPAAPKTATTGATTKKD
jgi:hypothetical protein